MQKQVTRGQVGVLLERVVRGLARKSGRHDPRLILDWKNIVGPKFAAYTIPGKFSQAGQALQATLTVEVQSASRMTLLAHQDQIFIERINGYLGYKAVDRIRFIVAPVSGSRSNSTKPEATVVLNSAQKKEIDQTVADVSNEELQKALRRFGEQLSRKKLRENLVKL